MRRRCRAQPANPACLRLAEKAGALLAAASRVFICLHIPAVAKELPKIGLISMRVWILPASCRSRRSSCVDHRGKHRRLRPCLPLGRTLGEDLAITLRSSPVPPTKTNGLTCDSSWSRRSTTDPDLIRDEGAASSQPGAHAPRGGQVVSTLPGYWQWFVVVPDE